MVSDVVLTGPDGLDEGASRPTDGVDSAAESTREPARMPTGKRRGRRIAAATLLVLGCLFSGLCLLLLVATWRDDSQIDAHQGRTVADVLSVSFTRTAVRFVAPDGTVVIPTNGLLYPTGLAAGEQVRVEYDTKNTELVRVAGRDFRLAFLPVGMSLVICWAIVGPVVWFLRRKPASGPISERQPPSTS
ncbi:MAG TPA: DUF3592 domain-containing protein [Pseudonocardiaceae bacterium]|nr:DUF3592 domain-containing protein [Pseudonocardiaceae bacterium]